jgi:tRNA(adenine34) deaminase
MNTSESDNLFFEHAIRLALQAEKAGNLPIGAVISIDGQMIAEGTNAIWYPHFDGTRHAEIEALRNVPEHLWQNSREMTLYTTLEPCLMCMGAILLHNISRVLYGSADHFGGASKVIGYMPTYFEEEISNIEWLGPAYPGKCDPLFERVKSIERKRGLNM